MPVTTNTYVLGAVPRLTAAFADVDGVPADPSHVQFKIIEPDADRTVTTFESGADVQLVRDSAGVYYVDWTTRVAGVHCFRFVGTGAVRAVAERHFTVDAGCFA